jgi:TPR repeat protein
MMPPVYRRSASRPAGSESFYPALALAMAYECGRGVEADREKARYLYAVSSDVRECPLADFFLELMDDPAIGDI